MIYALLTSIIICVIIIIIMLILGTRSHPSDEAYKEWFNEFKKKNNKL